MDTEPTKRAKYEQHQVGFSTIYTEHVSPDVINLVLQFASIDALHHCLRVSKDFNKSCLEILAHRHKHYFYTEFATIGAKNFNYNVDETRIFGSLRHEPHYVFDRKNYAVNMKQVCRTKSEFRYELLELLPEFELLGLNLLMSIAGVSEEILRSKFIIRNQIKSFILIFKTTYGSTWRLTVQEQREPHYSEFFLD
jgi:hypothetical protein